MKNIFIVFILFFGQIHFLWAKNVGHSVTCYPLFKSSTSIPFESDYLDYQNKYLSTKDETGRTVLDYLNFDPPSNGDEFLSFAEWVSIAHYTLANKVEQRIMLTGALKLPLSEGRFYRGQRRDHYNIQEPGQVIRLTRITSLSKNKYVAENFIGDPNSKGEIWVVNAVSARDISKYSQCIVDGTREEELLLLPNIKLKVNKIYTDNCVFFDEVSQQEKQYPVRHIEFTEIH